MHIHHRTFLVIFLPQSWYGRDQKCQLRDTVSISKDHLLVRKFQYQILVFLKTKSIFLWLHCLLTTNGQFNATWLPYTTNQFHVQHYLRFSSKRPELVRAWQTIFFSSAVIFYLLSKSFINENYLDKYKNKKMYAKIVLRWEFASVY